MPQVPLTLPVADKVPVPPSPEVLRGVPMHRHHEPHRKMKESVGNLIIVGWMVVGCYPTENPLASGGRAGRSP